jgi:hypothetical protein
VLLRQRVHLYVLSVYMAILMKRLGTAGHRKMMKYHNRYLGYFDLAHPFYIKTHFYQFCVIFTKNKIEKTL